MIRHIHPIPRRLHVFSLLSFILGLVSAILCYLIYINPNFGALRMVIFAGIATGIVGILNYNGRKHRGRWVGFIGLIFSIAAFGILVFIVKEPWIIAK